jgi:hypothetical protein
VSAAARIREQEPVAFSSGGAREARYLRDLEALLRERAAVGERTLAIWGSQQKPPLVGTEVERLMGLLVEQEIASSSRRHINAPLLWKRSNKQAAPPPVAAPLPAKALAKGPAPSKAPIRRLVPSALTLSAPSKPSALSAPAKPSSLGAPSSPSASAQQAKKQAKAPAAAPPRFLAKEPPAAPAPEPSAATTPEPLAATLPNSQLPDSQRPPSSFPPPARRQKASMPLAGDTAPPAPPGSPVPSAPAEFSALAPTPAELLCSVPPPSTILPPRLENTPTAPSPMPPPGAEIPLEKLTSEVVLKLGLSLRDRERLGQQLIAIGQLLRGDLKANPGVQGLSESTARVLQAMTSTPETPVQIARRLGMDGQQVSNAVKTLSLRGLVVRVAHGLWRLA